MEMKLIMPMQEVFINIQNAESINTAQHYIRNQNKTNKTLSIEIERVN
jgi:hypothetical protein